MRVLLTLIVALTAFTSSPLLAHPGGHGEMRLEIGEKQALDIVQSMTKALTFKDRGYSVGKIDSSWEKVPKQAFKLVDESSSAFVYKVTNKANKQTLVLSINKNGRVASVNDEAVTTHGHQH